MSRKGFLVDQILTNASIRNSQIGPLILRAIDMAPYENPNRGTLVRHMAMYTKFKFDADIRKVEKEWTLNLLCALKEQARKNMVIGNPRIIKKLLDLASEENTFKYCFGVSSIKRQIEHATQRFYGGAYNEEPESETEECVVPQKTSVPIYEVPQVTSIQ